MKKEVYEKVRKEHPELPEYEKIDWEFEISTIEKDSFPLRRIRRKITDKLERLAEILQSILSPDPNSFVDIYECRMYNEEDKKEIFEICRKLMYQDRLFTEVALKRDDKAEAEAIASAYKLWVEHRGKAIEMVQKMKDSWQKDIETKEVFSYMG